MEEDTQSLCITVMLVIVLGSGGMLGIMQLAEYTQQSQDPIERNIIIFDKYTTYKTTGGIAYNVFYSVENSTDIIQEDNMSLYYHVETGNTYRAVFFNENSIQRIGLL